MPYGFTSPGANAGNAILQFLMQREEEKRQQLIDELTRAEREQQMSIRDQEMQRRTAADTRADEERQTAQRAETNQAGVRGMMADAMTQGAMTPDARKTIGIMALREGMDVPPQIAAMDAEEAEARTRSSRLADYESQQMIDASIEAQQPRDPANRYRTVGGSIFDTDTRGFMSPPGQGGAGGGSRGGGNSTSSEGQPSAYAMETATRTIQAVDDVLPKITNLTAGGGSLLKMVPGSDAANVAADLSSVAANVAFNALQAMREASKTGGALGQVSERELDLLSAVEGSIRQNQSPENLKRNLLKIRESMARFQAAAQGQGGGGDDGGGWTTLPNGVRVRKKAR